MTTSSIPNGFLAWLRSFSFLEVMSTLVLVGVTGLLVGKFVADVPSKQETNLRKAREGVMLINSAVGAYSFDLNLAPPKSEDGGLNILIDAEYIDAVPNDPWGRPYHYQYPAVASGMPFDLYSLGPDGVESEDDVANWNLYGRAYRGTSRIARKRDRAASQSQPD